MSASNGETVDFTSVDNFYLQVLLRHGLVTLMMTIGLYAYLLGMLTRGAFCLTDRDATVLVGVAASICVANFVALATVGINITLFWICWARLSAPATSTSRPVAGEDHLEDLPIGQSPDVTDSRDARGRRSEFRQLLDDRHHALVCGSSLCARDH